MKQPDIKKATLTAAPLLEVRRQNDGRPGQGRERVQQNNDIPRGIEGLRHAAAEFPAW